MVSDVGVERLAGLLVVVAYAALRPEYLRSKGTRISRTLCHKFRSGKFSVARSSVCKSL